MLHEVATGGLHSTNVVQPVREIVKCVNDEFIQAEVKSIDTDKKIVITEDGIVKFDKLIIALGSQSCFYNIPGAEHFSYPLKNLNDAKNIRNQCLKLLQTASEQGKNVDESLLRWIVVGGGPTGIELAAELTELAKDFAERAPMLAINKLDIQVHNGSEQILGMFSEKTRRIALRTLKNHGIKIVNSSLITEVSEDSATTQKGVLKTKFVSWTAGIEPVSIKITPEPKKTRGRLNTEDNLTLEGAKDVYVVGDIAYDKTAPQTAQAAVSMGKHVAKSIIRNNDKPFVFKQKGLLLSLGQWKSAGTLGPFSISGLLGWWLWRTVYLSKLIGIPNKIRTLVDWNIDIFYRRDIAEM
jgi:NADH dehydrogenase